MVTVRFCEISIFLVTSLIGAAKSTKRDIPDGAKEHA
jgi:hypothetical protein